MINRIPTQVLQRTSPFQKLFSRNPNFEKLKVFGCLCFPWLRPYTSNKLDGRSTPCVFLGYSITQSAYFCLDRNTSRIYTSLHVLFHETVFPFSVAGRLTTTPCSSQFEDVSVTTSSVTPTQIYRQPEAPPAPSPPAAHTETTAATTPSGAQQTAAPGPPPSPAPTAETTDTSSPAAPQQQPTRMSTRNRKPVQKLNLHATVQHPNETIPTSVAEALKDPRWRAAMQAEIDFLFRNKT